LGPYVGNLASLGKQQAHEHKDWENIAKILEPEQTTLSAKLHRFKTRKHQDVGWNIGAI